MRRLAALAALAVLSTAGAARAAGPAPLLGIVGDRVLDQQLVRFDPATLRPLPGAVPLAAHRAGWSFSADRTRLVLGRARAACGPTTLRFVDTVAMRTLGDVRVAADGRVVATAWLGSGLVAAVVGPGACVRQTRVVAVAVDAGGRRVVGTTWLRGDVLRTARLAGQLVLLLGPRDRVGAARLAVVDSTGAVRQRTLEAIPAGRTTLPGLAVDPAGPDRAFVVPDGDRLAEIDLGTLRGLVAYTLAGRELYRLFPGEQVGRVAAIGGQGYAAVGRSTASFELATGAPRPAVDRPLWELLLGAAA